MNKRQEHFPNLLKGNPGNNGGRPSKYDPQFIEDAHTYLAEVEEKRKKVLTLPTIEEFAIRIGVDPLTIERWCNLHLKDNNGSPAKQLVHPEFCSAIKRIKMVQKMYLMRDGLYGGRKVNVALAIFLLKMNHNMKETIRTDVTTKGESINPVIVGFKYMVPLE